ncbi:hypothetical protein [Psychroserpens sp. SPM9]|uniref:hypothetical protein n=1 Tax=Psychroserpens sp. SPM9 TaxID=2975598 RepID=UPI0021A522DA|nr:hypothetical protein [Psychroserpens sp. SPM9]MDG5492004.1 hypothetical protein [Psychroserpens sp. SPM9]
MIKFFRNIRKQLLTENKTGKPVSRTGRYFKYAIGEIILVMIGVLLAIQANNLNEARKKNESVANVNSRIISDIERNIQSANILIAQYKDMEYLYKKVLNDSISESLLNEGLENLTTGIILFEYDKTGIERLKGLELQDDNSVEIIRIYESANLHINASVEIIESNIRRNLIEWRDTYDWFQKYVKFELDDEAKDYFVNSQDYKNKVSYSYMCIYQSYIPTIENFILELKNWKKNNIEKINEG